jgi:hypothetical protein
MKLVYFDILLSVLKTVLVFKLGFISVIEHLQTVECLPMTCIIIRFSFSLTCFQL